MLRGILWIGGEWRSFFSVLRPSSGNGIGMFCVCAGIFSFFQRTSFFAVRAVGGAWRSFFGVLAVKLVESVFRCAYSGVSMKIGFCPATGFWKGTSGIFFWGGIVGAV